MSFDGSGTYNRVPGSAYTNGTTNDGSELDAEMNDIATALSLTLTRDGQATASANQPMGTYRHTNVGNPTARTQYASVAGVQDGTYTYLTSVAGTNTITATAALSMTAYATGQGFVFTPANANTAATTINVNSIGAKNIFVRGAACVGGELPASVPVFIVYDGTQFNAITYAPAGWALLATKTASASASLTFEAADGLGTTYTRYMFDITALAPATDDVSLYMQVGTGAGPTYQTANYQYGGRLSGPGGGADTGSTVDGVTAAVVLSRSGAGFGIGNAAGEIISGQVFLESPGAAGYRVINAAAGYIRSDGAIQSQTVSGTYTPGGAITGVRFLMSSGNITSGVIRMYGLRK